MALNRDAARLGATRGRSGMEEEGGGAVEPAEPIEKAIFSPVNRKLRGFFGLAPVQVPRGQFFSGFLHRSVGRFLGDEVKSSTICTRSV